MNAEPTTVDSREPDWQEIYITDVTVNADSSTLHLLDALSGHSPHQYEGGTVIPASGFTLGVIDHTTNNTIEANRAPTPPEIPYVTDQEAVVKDDNPNSGLLPRFFTMTPFIRNAYADAYINIVNLDVQHNPNRSVDFDLYLSSTEMSIGEGWNNSKDVDSANDYWASFVVAGYQAGALFDQGMNQWRDNDPDPLVDNSTYPLCPCWPGEEYNETLTGGWTASFGDWDSIVFRAVIVDFPKHAHYESQVIAHEIGHSGGNTGTPEEHYNEGGLMTGDSLTEDIDSFTAPTLKRFREAEKW